MVKRVRWSPEAESRFIEVIDYLRSESSDRDAIRFIQRTDATVRILMRFPGISRKGRKGTREVLITKHNVLCFRIKGDELQVVGFRDTRQHPRTRRTTNP